MQWIEGADNGLTTPGMIALIIGMLVFAWAVSVQVRKLIGFGDPSWQALLAALVPILTGTTYLSIFLGTGVVQLSDGRIFHVARWIDACFGTPLILLNILLLLGPLPKKLCRWSFCYWLPMYLLCWVGYGQACRPTLP